MRAGFSLAEVLVAAAILSAGLVPLLFTFLTSLGDAAQDVRQIRAAALAQEIMAQVVQIQRNNGRLFPIPLEPGTELELDPLVPADDPAVGFPLFPARGYRVLSRLHISAPQPGYRRYLTISFDEVGRDRGVLFSPTALYRVTVRVAYTTPLSGREVSRDLKVSALLFSDSSREGGEFE